MITIQAQRPQDGGLPYAFSAYLIWGFLPVYFKLLKHVPALDILAFRIVWSVPVVFIILYFRRQWGEFVSAISNPAARRAMMLSAVLIAINWLVYVWAITSDRVLATSIGYYLNPLVNVLLGRLFLGERLTRLQGWAVAVAGLAVAILLGGSLETVWISLTLAISFGTYGLVRKTAPTGSVPGLAVEMCLLGPVALAVCIWSVMEAGGLARPANRDTAGAGRGGDGNTAIALRHRRATDELYRARFRAISRADHRLSARRVRLWRAARWHKAGLLRADLDGHRAVQPRRFSPDALSRLTAASPASRLHGKAKPPCHWHRPTTAPRPAIFAA